MNLPHRWSNLPDSHLVTRAEVEAVTGISKSSLCAHSYAGLLPFIPGRPVHIRLGDLKLYLRMMSNGVSRSLHRSMRVAHEDRQAYSVLHGIAEFTAKPPDQMINAVVRETGYLWKKYKAQKAAEKNKTRNKRIHKDTAA
jgi:hypothetical protein